MTTETNPDAGTVDVALDVAERLMQTRGFNGFSYADIAKELGITRAALHYHFAGKAELGESLIERYSARFDAALAEADATNTDAVGKLEAYVALYRSVLQQKRMCLCGMLAAEHEGLPAGMRRAVVDFFDRNEAWLARVLGEGRRAAELEFDGSADDVAQAFVGSLEGAMLVARIHDRIETFEVAAQRQINSLIDGEP